MAMTMIAPSLLAADFSAMGEQLRRVQQAEAVHIDIMDGNFVPNLSMGPQMVEALRPQSSQIFDVHLMLLHPLPMCRSSGRPGRTGLPSMWSAPTTQSGCFGPLRKAAQSPAWR